MTHAHHLGVNFILSDSISLLGAEIFPEFPDALAQWWGRAIVIMAVVVIVGMALDSTGNARNGGLEGMAESRAGVLLVSC